MRRGNLDQDHGSDPALLCLDLAMAMDLSCRAVAGTQLEPMAEATFEGKLPRPHGNTKHGLKAKRPIIRALLPEDETEAWDRAPVPSNCPEMLEEIFREFCVLKYRVHRWESDAEQAATVTVLQARIDLLKMPLRGLLKAVEVHARIIEGEHEAESGDAIMAYLRTLPAHKLESYIMEGAPRIHPGTGQPILSSYHEHREEHIAD